MSFNMHESNMGYRSITKFYKTLKLNWLCSKISKCNVNGPLRAITRCLDDSHNVRLQLTSHMLQPIKYICVAVLCAVIPALLIT